MHDLAVLLERVRQRAGVADATERHASWRDLDALVVVARRRLPAFARALHALARRHHRRDDGVVRRRARHGRAARAAQSRRMRAS